MDFSVVKVSCLLVFYPSVGPNQHMCKSLVSGSEDCNLNELEWKGDEQCDLKLSNMESVDNTVCKTLGRRDAGFVDAGHAFPRVGRTLAQHFRSRCHTSTIHPDVIHVD